MKKTRFKRSNHFPEGSKEPIRELLKLFPFRKHPIQRFPGFGWTTSQYPLSDTEILKAFARVSNRIYGVRFGRSSRYAVLDIDKHSRYHSPESVAQIRNCLRADGFGKTIIYRSSHSGGWHIYLFF